MTAQPLKQGQVDDVLRDIKDLTLKDAQGIATFVRIRACQVAADNRYRARRLRRWPAVFTGRAAVRAEDAAKVADGLRDAVAFCQQILEWMLDGARWGFPPVEGEAWYRLAQSWEELVALASPWHDDDDYNTERWRGQLWSGDTVRAASRESEPDDFETGATG